MLPLSLQIGSPIDTYDRLITGPSLEPLDLDEAKRYLRFTPTSEDTLIDAMITAAREYFEQQTGVICLTQVWEHTLSGSPSASEIELPKAPLQSIVSIATGDDSPEEMSTDDYSVLSGTTGAVRPGRVRLASGASWPSFTEPVSGALRVQYRAGFGDAPGDVPQVIKFVIGMLLGSMHKFRAETHEQNDGSIVEIPIVRTIINDYKYRNLRTLVPRYGAWVSTPAS